MKLSAAEIDSLLFAEQGSNPATPASGFGRLFVKSDGLYLIDDTGAVAGPFAVTAGDAFARPVPGMQSATERLWSIPGVNLLASGGTNGRAGNFTYYEPFVVDSDTVLNEVGLEVTTAGSASSVISLALLDADEDWQPTSLVANLGTVTAASTGVKTITGLTQAVPAGRYLWGFRTNSTSTVQHRQLLGMVPGLGIRSTFGATPNPTNMYKAETYSATWTSPTPWDTNSFASNYFSYAIAGRWALP